MAARPRFTTAVIAIGDEHRHDDGLPFAVVAHIARRRDGRQAPPRTTLASSVPDAGRLIRLWDGMELAVVVTARPAPFGQPVRMHRLAADAEEAPPDPTDPARSRHPGLDEAMNLGRALGRMPNRMIVFAIEGVGPEPGAEPSERFTAIVAELADRIEEEIRRDQRQHDRLGGTLPGPEVDLGEPRPGSDRGETRPGADASPTG